MTNYVLKALRGEAALKSRLPKEPKRNAAIIPCDKTMAETAAAAFPKQQLLVEEENDPPCIGDLLQHTRKGKFFLDFRSDLFNFRQENSVHQKGFFC